MHGVRRRAWILVLAAACGPQASTSESTGAGEGDGAPGETSAASATSASDDGPPNDTHDLGGGSADGSTGDSPACVCAIVPDRQDFASCGWTPTCELPQPCPRLTVTCPRPGGDLYDCGPEYVYDTDAMRCALEILRDDVPAHLLVDGDEDWGIFSGQEMHEIFVPGGAPITVTTCMATDVGGEGWAGLVGSAGPDHFASCLEIEVPRDQYACLWAGLSRPTDVPACP